VLCAKYLPSAEPFSTPKPVQTSRQAPSIATVHGSMRSSAVFRLVDTGDRPAPTSKLTLTPFIKSTYKHTQPPHAPPPGDCQHHSIQRATRSLEGRSWPVRRTNPKHNLPTPEDRVHTDSALREPAGTPTRSSWSARSAPARFHRRQIPSDVAPDAPPNARSNHTYTYRPPQTPAAASAQDRVGGRQGGAGRNSGMAFDIMAAQSPPLASSP
jgi:hypothetical protein